MLTRTATVFTMLVVLAAASPLGAQPLDPTATEALATTLKTLIDPTQRSSAIAGNPQATSIDQQIRSLTGSEAVTQDFYALALDVFSELTVAAVHRGHPRVAGAPSVGLAELDPRVGQA